MERAFLRRPASLVRFMAEWVKSVEKVCWSMSAAFSTVSEERAGRGRSSGRTDMAGAVRLWGHTAAQMSHP